LSVEEGNEKCAELLLEAGSNIDVLTHVRMQNPFITLLLAQPGLWEGLFLLSSVCIGSLFA